MLVQSSQNDFFKSLKKRDLFPKRPPISLMTKDSRLFFLI